MSNDKKNNMKQQNQEFLEKDKVSFIHDHILSDPATSSDLSALLKTDTLFICVINIAAVTPYISVRIRIFKDL